MNRITRNIPNSITCLNILAGTAATVCASGATQPLWGLLSCQWAFIFIAVAATADFLDGFAARALHAYSELGKQLDSLCDLVSFGVAPAMVIFHLLQQTSPLPWLPWTALLIPAAGAVRLARFNIDPRQTTSFIGLPIPANAIFWTGFAALLLQPSTQWLASWWCFLPVLLTECWLMNSPLPIFSLKIKSLKGRENLPRWLLLIAAAVFCLSLGVAGLMWLIVFYVLLSLAFKS